MLLIAFLSFITILRFDNLIFINNNIIPILSYLIYNYKFEAILFKLINQCNVM